MSLFYFYETDHCRPVSYARIYRYPYQSVCGPVDILTKPFIVDVPFQHIAVPNTMADQYFSGLSLFHCLPHGLGHFGKPAA